MISAAILELGPALIAAAGLAAVTPALIRADLAHHRLPNRLVGIAALALVPAIAWQWMLEGAFPAAPPLSGVAAGFAYLALSIGGGMGMGDVKLAAVLACGGALASPLVALGGFMLAFLLGGLLAAGVLVRRAIRPPHRPGRVSGAHIATQPVYGDAGRDRRLRCTRQEGNAEVPVAAHPMGTSPERASPARIPFGPAMLTAHWLCLLAHLSTPLAS